METIPSPRLGFLTGVFLANHLASTDNLAIIIIIIIIFFNNKLTSATSTQYRQ